MTITNKNRAENSLKWINQLPNFMQWDGELGNEITGYDVFGAGCIILNIPFHPNDNFSNKLKKATGLLSLRGTFKEEIDGFESLDEMNEKGVSFKRMRKYMKDYHHLIFKKKVSKYINKILTANV